MMTCLTPIVRGLQKGRRKGAMSKNVKNRQKVSKSFSTLFDNFRAGQKTSKIVKKCHKNIFDTFGQFSRGTSFPAPFGGALILFHHHFRLSMACLNRLRNYLQLSGQDSTSVGINYLRSLQRILNWPGILLGNFWHA